MRYHIIVKRERESMREIERERDREWERDHGERDWTTVQPRRRKAMGFGLYKTDRPPRNQDGDSERIIIYYFTNFLED